MEFGDEEIVTILNEYKKSVYGDIYKGFYIKEDFYKFERKSILDNKLSLMLPIRFNLMDESNAKLKYIGNTPDIIYTNRKYTIDLTFSYEDKQFNDEMSKESIDVFEDIMKKLYPGNMIFEKDMVEALNTKIYWIDYRNETIDTSLYNLYFSCLANGKNIYGRFICDYRKASLWKQVFIEILKTIEVYDEE